MATKKRGLQYTDEQAGAEATEVETPKGKTLADVFAETKVNAQISLCAPGKPWWRYTRTEEGYERNAVPGFNPGSEHSFVKPEDFSKYDWRY